VTFGHAARVASRGLFVFLLGGLVEEHPVPFLLGGLQLFVLLFAEGKEGQRPLLVYEHPAHLRRALVDDLRTARLERFVVNQRVAQGQVQQFVLARLFELLRNRGHRVREKPVGKTFRRGGLLAFRARVAARRKPPLAAAGAAVALPHGAASARRPASTCAATRQCARSRHAAPRTRPTAPRSRRAPASRRVRAPVGAGPPRAGRRPSARSVRVH